MDIICQQDRKLESTAQQHWNLFFYFNSKNFDFHAIQKWIFILLQEAVPTISDQTQSISKCAAERDKHYKIRPLTKID